VPKVRIVEETSRANAGRGRPLSLVCGKNERREAGIMHGPLHRLGRIP
jgi:hypothetical protein